MEKTGVRKLWMMQLSAVTVPLGEGRTLEMSSGCYLLEMADGEKILIDSGMPGDVASSTAAGAPKARDEKNVLQHLEELRVRPESIGTVVCTHFDVDHVGYHEHFAGAEFVVQRTHYESAKGGHARYERGRRHWDDPRLQYRMVDGDTQLVAGVELIETSGHCIGHQSVLVRLPNSGTVLLAIDAAILKRTFTVERKAGPFDENEELLRASTKKMLDLVEREKVETVIFGHDGEQWAGLRRAPEFWG